MCAKEQETKPGYIESVVKNKCPRCRRGNMFLVKSSWQKGYLNMPETCDVCEQPMEIETGFYYGTGYVSYALTVALSVASFIAWWIIIGFSLSDHRIFWWLGFNSILLISLQRWLMRLSRTLWLSFFVRYNPTWKQEQTQHDQHLTQTLSEAI